MARRNANRVFDGIAGRERTSTGWFYGFKLHLHFNVNDSSELLSVKLTSGNTDECQSLPNLIKGLKGHLYGDEGYLSKARCDELAVKGVALVTNVRSDMKPRKLSLWDKIMLRN